MTSPPVIDYGRATRERREAGQMVRFLLSPPMPLGPRQSADFADPTGLRRVLRRCFR